MSQRHFIYFTLLMKIYKQLAKKNYKIHKNILNLQQQHIFIILYYSYTNKNNR